MNSNITRPLRPPWDRLFPIITRLFVWGLLFGVLFILRSFFLLIFLTFVFAYIQGHAVVALKDRVRPRALRVVLVSALFLGILTGIVCFIVPQVKEQADLFAAHFSSYIQGIDQELTKLSENYPVVERIAPEVVAMRSARNSAGHLNSWTPEMSPTIRLAQSLMGFDPAEDGHMDVKAAFTAVKGISTSILAVGSAFLLSLLFAFLIILDLPHLSRSLQALADTRVGFIYREVAPSLLSFAKVLGRALEAQLMIAIMNTILTAIGIYFLGLGAHSAFLSMIVFLCSFIPVAGVFMSSAPICLIALQMGGFTMLFLSIALILAIHFVETYVLNPRIFGRHLHINPVLVLMILTIGGKLFQVWGLVLGVPICTYLFAHAIRYSKEEIKPDSQEVVIKP